MTTAFLYAGCKDDVTAREYLRDVDVLAGVDGVARD
jgi:hypothetical protein